METATESRQLLDKLDQMNVDSSVLEVLLKMVFGLPAEDSANTIRRVLSHWRRTELESELAIKEDAPPIVQRIWKNYERIERCEQMEAIMKIQRRINLVKLYLDYQLRIIFAIDRGQLQVESTNRKKEGRALVNLE